jgi:GNAT superfamily N-acetyltransferase
MNTDSAQVRLRTGTHDDTLDVLKLWGEAEAAPSTTDDPDGLNRLLATAPSSLLIAEHQAQIVGTLIATFDGWRGNLYRLAVQPAHRRRGVARSLVIEGEHRLRSAGARRITALIATNSTAPKSSGGRPATVPIRTPPGSSRRFPDTRTGTRPMRRSGLLGSADAMSFCRVVRQASVSSRTPNPAR